MAVACGREEAEEGESASIPNRGALHTNGLAADVPLHGM